jgi:hypothetical protein
VAGGQSWAGVDKERIRSLLAEKIVLQSLNQRLPLHVQQRTRSTESLNKSHLANGSANLTAERSNDRATDFVDLNWTFGMEMIDRREAQQTRSGDPAPVLRNCRNAASAVATAVRGSSRSDEVAPMDA